MDEPEPPPCGVSTKAAADLVDCAVSLLPQRSSAPCAGSFPGWRSAGSSRIAGGAQVAGARGAFCSQRSRLACREAFTELSFSRWTCRPEFVDQIDVLPVNTHDDLPALRSVGVLLPLPEPADAVQEQAVRDDVSQLIGAMSDLARG